jgi:hypothetical protein
MKPNDVLLSQMAATTLKSEKESLENKLEEIEATVDYMDTLVS